MKVGPTSSLPDGPAKPMKQKPAIANQNNAAGPKLQLRSGPGMQKSLNPKKNQPKTMRFLRG